ncbi:D-alanyl-D-alanine carboxypeptidase/D-alanyl-D-alanine endopeptidase [Propionibacteriaceae bacterium G1746]|uniref:D-alanyl-D-alanine carboxypeptidase/D-alanyl-D-alanine endopeptidase n=1 Tax=Aestuariimicrobium sp. G57 TaxID=3418485 RepID=UPI003C1B8B7E
MEPPETMPQRAPQSAPRKRTRLAAGAVAMVAVGAVGASVFAHQPLLRALGLRDARVLPPAATTLFPQPSATGSSSDPSVVVGTAGPASPSAGIVPAKLAAQVTAVPQRFGGTSSALVLDSATGAVLYANRQSQRMIPASNMKTLTMLGVLHAIPGETRLTTAVTQPQAGVLVLRGGGDPYLNSVPDPTMPGTATTQQLAVLTAAALKAEGVTSVTVGFDQTLFVGPEWAPTWPAGYVDQVTRVRPLMVDGGRTRGADGRITATARTTTPALSAATVFAAQLKANGITVTGTITERQAGTTAPIATIQSLPVEQVVTHAMVASDNTATEMMLRHLALATGAAPSFEGGTTALKQVLTELGVWRQGAVFADGSGLSRSNLVTAEMLGAAWTTIAASDDLRDLLTATPVARASGTLRERFLIDEAAPGRGRVHAKTGTLSEVSSLSGWTLTASGQSVVLVLLVNQSKDDWWARAWIDTVAAEISECGCS